MKKDKIKTLKKLIQELHDGAEVSSVKERFDRLVRDVDPGEIAAMEEQLIREGLPAEEVQRLCDVHVTVLKGSLEKEELPAAPPGHPVHTFIEENKVISALVGQLDNLMKTLGDAPDAKRISELKPRLQEILGKLKKIDFHYLRKENQLFPALEKHGITGPSQVMWGIHDEIRALIKDLGRAIEAGDAGTLKDKAPSLSRSVVEMVYKENKILFPLAMGTLDEDEWLKMRKGEEEIGFVFVTPGTEWPEEVPTEDEGRGIVGTTKEDRINLDRGELDQKQINLLLKHLPVDVTFVDENDQVAYYSEGMERIFPRSPDIIGRLVHNCHPPKSVRTVRRILEAFRNGEKDAAAFWLNLNGRLIYIRYFAVRDTDGEYQGTLEVSQDLTEIKTIEGERRLLNWDESE